MPVEMSHRPNARKGGLSTLLMLTGCSGQDGEGQQAGAGGMPPAAVVVQQATLADVTVRQDYAGRARGAREVEVRARISGILEQRLYEEGQMVREGDALFRIDRKPAAAALQRARAQRQVAEADVQQAEREWNRISSLFERNAVSERDRDSAQSALELARANLAVANAGVAQAELDLGYTDVTAPISGVTSLEDFPEGSLIDTGTLLTTWTRFTFALRCRKTTPTFAVLLVRAWYGQTRNRMSRRAWFWPTAANTALMAASTLPLQPSTPAPARCRPEPCSRIRSM
jgi:membrane fusion protein (multidrug efflux system)